MRCCLLRRFCRIGSLGSSKKACRKENIVDGLTNLHLALGKQKNELDIIVYMVL